MPADRMQHAGGDTNLADLLERVLDKGVVIAGDIKINLVQVELLTIQLRLVIASVDRARELGLDWWSGNPYFSTIARQAPPGSLSEPVPMPGLPGSRTAFPAPPPRTSGA